MPPLKLLAVFHVLHCGSHDFGDCPGALQPIFFLQPFETYGLASCWTQGFSVSCEVSEAHCGKPGNLRASSALRSPLSPVTSDVDTTVAPPVSIQRGTVCQATLQVLTAREPLRLISNPSGRKTALWLSSSLLNVSRSINACSESSRVWLLIFKAKASESPEVLFVCLSYVPACAHVMNELWKKVLHFPRASPLSYYRLGGWGWLGRIAEKKCTKIAIILGGRGPGKVRTGTGVEVGGMGVTVGLRSLTNLPM